MEELDAYAKAYSSSMTAQRGSLTWSTFVLYKAKSVTRRQDREASVSMRQIAGDKLDETLFTSACVVEELANMSRLSVVDDV